jgi:Tfp pilus assembly PilM family ATPase
VKKSITFFSSRYNGVKIERVIVTGVGSTIPELPLRVANKTGIQVEIGNPWMNTTYPSTVHNELMAVSSSFAVAAGLAERKGV